MARNTYSIRGLLTKFLLLMLLLLCVRIDLTAAPFPIVVTESDNHPSQPMDVADLPDELPLIDSIADLSDEPPLTNPVADLPDGTPMTNPVADKPDEAPITNPVDNSFYKRYRFIHFVKSCEDADSVQLTDDDLLDNAGKIIFRVNRAELSPNDSLLKELEEVIIPRINRDSLRLCRMVLRGAASPEGSLAFNRLLGQRRTDTLCNFLRARLNIPVDYNFSTETVSEDYRLLCALMRRAEDPALSTVQALCDQYLPKLNYITLKSRLKKVDGGRLWRRLLRDYYPELRATRFILFLFFEDAKETQIVPPIPQDTVVTETPDTLEIPEVIDVPEPPVKSGDGRFIRREVLSVKTNLLFDFAYMPGYNRWCPIPNVALEYYPLHGHFTFGASLDFPWWQHHNEHKFFEIRNYQLEARYYLRSGDIRTNPPGGGMAFRGLYFQGYVHGGLYSICFDENNGWEGEGIGAGVGLGWVQPLGKSRRWRLEFGVQFGFFFTKYDPYVYEHPIYKDFKDNRYYYNWLFDPDDFNRRAHRFTWFGPTRVGITLTYDLLFRRGAKRGVSFNSSEKIPIEPRKEGRYE